ncbi:N-6 DNA methylase [Pedobacter sp. KBS0701]|uniref:HsdM family class I SAM-dependent methyltransferase n=1 Tax=Pedobacter sp. KBS0701 TaxID=2578106 RepID=UPI00110DD44C|nr:N-6 DNA methylase [Pedobacter sp. KBS0701]QDW27500.1 N-6 DNA methylase [Pedobacter sp. KBS0701]
MTSKIYSFLKQQNISAPELVDNLIVSAYVSSNKLKVKKNNFIISHIIRKKQKDNYQLLLNFLDLMQVENIILDFEALIELFEFVVSPSDKVVNGAVFTPETIRRYIVDNSLSNFNGEFANVKIADISCGCGGFLLTLAQEIANKTGRSFYNIYSENLYGIDIAGYSIKRTKILLSLYAVLNGQDETEFQFNLFTNNSLSFKWYDACPEIKENEGFDIIVGNPPYVCSRNMDKETIELLKNWEVSKTGHPDLYIPFFQIGLENINKKGILGFITVNTFIKSVNGRAIREYFDVNNIELSLISFGGEQIFQDRNTYTCICFLRHDNRKINFIRLKSSQLDQLDLTNLIEFDYKDLNHHDGWNLVNDLPMVNYINQIERIGKPFKDLYNTKNGIATLKNDVYKFRPLDEDDRFYYLMDENIVYSIEVDICKKIVNANKLKSEADIDRLREQIIFPYDNQTKIIPENVMRTTFPNAYAYLQTKKEVLSNRDKGTREYETWYAYGRRQSMDIHAYKLFFPHICERPTFVICEDMDLLFYNGIAIVSDDLDKLRIIKRLMESDVFFKYIKNTTKDYSSGYISMSRNYLKNFGVYQFDEDQIDFLLTTDNVEPFLEEIYGLIEFQDH